MSHQTNLNLKAILHSKRANVYYLEHCRVMQKDGRVLYLMEASNENQYFNIPIANTTVILLGNGTSITQAAVRMLAQAGVMIGFSGGKGTPLYAATEIEWLSPQSEYRPTEYLQGWLSFWFHDHGRLKAAKYLQHRRIAYLQKVWGKDRELQFFGFCADSESITDSLGLFLSEIDTSTTHSQLLTTEARLTKKLYKLAAKNTEITHFTRNHEGCDQANIFLNHGNYLAYGLAAVALWVLGIPHAFAVMHGKTRRGALVFDVADLIKDAIILPWSFICAKEKMKEQEFRQQCIQAFTDHKSLDYMFDTIKELAMIRESTEEI